jgi:hypothetical protein
MDFLTRDINIEVWQVLVFFFVIQPIVDWLVDHFYDAVKHLYHRRRVALHRQQIADGLGQFLVLDDVGMYV